ncbi:epoxyqueuosine reductase QueH [Campylobacter sp. faydin G-140]|uniref:epoxyqueuosine reductase QueH n=1 Tax=Campylobacter anatolicus TaxID=2829105 RepID=UPI001B9D9440|nr:epoxyqueuosine reductase QueH [Campylobacter anatolicus]MBR8465510.1 epoxyqueuosine reductase QueH [Campylobacter anatolicus]
MLVHICCSVDSHYFLRRLLDDFPDERLIGYFYDPNIHPYAEFVLRYEDVKRSCESLGVELICGDYDYEAWLDGTKGLENEPEKGKRCVYCFEFRMGNSAKMAKSLDETSITTTLLMSPKKDFAQLKNALDNTIKGTNLKAVAVDYRINGGTNAQFELAKKDKLYHQNYCGCIYGLLKQREAQNLPLYDLFSDVNGRVLPGSVQERLKLYKNVRECEIQGVKFHLSRKYFLNYRLLYGRVKFNDKVIPSYFVLYSNFKRQNVKLSVNEPSVICDELKDGVVLINLASFNEILRRVNGSESQKFKSIYELCKNPPSVESELNLRRELCGEFSQNPIIILDKICVGRYEINAKNVLYNDSHEILVVE